MTDVLLALAIACVNVALVVLWLRVWNLERRLGSADIDEDAPTSVPLSDQFPVTYDPVWEAGQKRQARDDLGVDV